MQKLFSNWSQLGQLSVSKMSHRFVKSVALATMLLPAAAHAQPNWDMLKPYNGMYENNNTDPTPGDGMRDCLRDDGAESWHTVKTDKNGNLLPFCAPDTLYVWLQPDRLRSYEMSFGNVGAWPSSVPPIYAAQGPLGSFGYGSISVRLKLKPGVKFVQSSFINDSCANARGYDIDNTVFFRIDTMDTLSDWTMCSPKVLHSWSYGTRTHYDEMVRDLRVLQKVSKAGGDLRGKMEIYSSKQGTDFFRPFNLDPGVNFSFNQLVSNFASESDLVSRGQHIYINPEMRQSQQQGEAEHIRSNSRLYFFRK